MESSRKSLRTNNLADIPFPSIHRASPANLEPVLELVKAEERIQSAEHAAKQRLAAQSAPANMLQSRRPSRLNLLSIFLPSFVSNADSKSEKDNALKKALPRIPITQQQIQDAPPRPPPKSPATGRPQTPPPSSKKLQKTETTPRKTLSKPNTPAASPNIDGKKVRAASGLIPPAHAVDSAHGRSVSFPINRPDSPDGELVKLPKRKSWLPGLGRRSQNGSSDDLGGSRSDAWINAGTSRIDYNLAFLIKGDKVPELWNEAADTFVYLFPESTGLGPSFKVPSMVLSSSLVLMHYIQTNRPQRRSFEGRQNLSVLDTPPYTPATTESQSSGSVSDGQAESLRSLNEAPREIHLRFPTGLTSDGTNLLPQDIQTLVEIRNLFAFLTGQPLVGTKVCPSIFRIFVSMGSLLRRFEFTNSDGSTFGESAATSFDFFLDELRLEDVRNSREKTLEGLVLGESMRCERLYSESFAHAVGKYAAVRDKELSLFDELSQSTRSMMERASLDLTQRQAAADVHLQNFDFPSLFAGFANSTTSEESKIVRFKAWKTEFLAMKKFMLSYLKDQHGSWPPKGNSKKNAFMTGGLNRLVLKSLYADLCALYDLKADRTELTPRTAGGDAEEAQTGDPTNAALRVLLSEFDRSSPPVNPPIPFDVPLVPHLSSVDPRLQLSPKEEHKLKNRSLKENETRMMLIKSHNIDVHYTTPFLDAYKAFEIKEGKRKTSLQLIDQTYGHWIFMYAVIQSLPLLVEDVKGTRYNEGVEYFLCMSPPGNMPWIEDAPKTAWYGVAGGQQVVSLPAYLVENGPEAVYRRSHCWAVADKWIGEANGEIEEEIAPAPMLSPLAPPPGFGEEFGARPPSRGRDAPHTTLSPIDRSSRSGSRQAKRQSIALGLERLPIPMGSPVTGSPTRGTPIRGTSPASLHQYHSPGGQRPRTSAAVEVTGATFDQILGGINNQTPQKGKGKQK